MSKARFAIIIDRGRIQAWQYKALRANLELLEAPLVLNCTNTQSRRRPLKWALYYGLNLISIRRGLGKFKPFNFDHTRWVDFKAIDQRPWQRIPADVAKIIEENHIDGILKFGMGLLIDPEELGLKYGVLSFHHGDPKKYRGRPAGFYELRNNEVSIGVILQRISNKLDGGEIIAIANAKIDGHSYCKTLQNAYAISEQVLCRGLQHAFEGKSIDRRSDGKIYSLPNNLEVLAFARDLIWRKVARLLYGALFFKSWNISRLSLGTDLETFLSEGNEKGLKQLRIGETAIPPKKSSGYADPFVDSVEGKIFVEEISRSNNIGQITCLDLNTLETRPMPDLGLSGHTSYPFFIRHKGRQFLLPEVASWSPPILFEISEAGGRKIELRGLENSRLVDATHFESRGQHYVFAGQPGRSSDSLYLFFSDNITGPYYSHPKNPIVMDVSCSRMGGPIVKCGGKLLRFGQNNSKQYGDGLYCCRISRISKSEYVEDKWFRLKVSNGKSGPHTFAVFEDKVIFDFYENKISIFAGLRRIKNHFTRRKTSKII